MINIEECYSTGTVQGASNVGGLIGFLYNARVVNSYSTSNLDETLGWRTTLWGREYMFRYFGGFAGSSGGLEVINCYSAGKVAGVPYGNYTQVEYKGFLGADTYAYNDVSSSYFDIDKAGRTDSFATAKSTQEMKQQITFNGWNFINIWGIESGFNDGYPFLLFSYTPTEGLNIFVITDTGLKQIAEIFVITDTGLKMVSGGNIISDVGLK